MAVKAVQQIQLGTVMGTEEQALKTMRLMKEAGYDGIELNGFMIKKMPPIVKILTKMAGMPVGNGGKLDWKKLMGQSGLSVVSVHEDLGSIKRAPEEIMRRRRVSAPIMWSLPACICSTTPTGRRSRRWRRI